MLRHRGDCTNRERWVLSMGKCRVWPDSKGWCGVPFCELMKLLLNASRTFWFDVRLGEGMRLTSVSEPKINATQSISCSEFGFVFIFGKNIFLSTCMFCYYSFSRLKCLLGFGAKATPQVIVSGFQWNRSSSNNTFLLNSTAPPPSAPPSLRFSGSALLLSQWFLLPSSISFCVLPLPLSAVATSVINSTIINQLFTNKKQ